MKKRFFLLMIVFILLLTACQGTGKPPAGYYKADSSTAINADGKMTSVMKELLPDFAVAEQSGNYVVYENIRPRQLKKYVKQLCDEGFSCEEAMLEYLLYREDMILFIVNNTENYGTFSISGFEQRKAEDGVTAQEAMAFVDDYVICMMERSDPELYHQTGLKTFMAAADTQMVYPDSYGTDPVNKGYTPLVYYVGSEGVLCLDNGVSGEEIYADLNGNGIQEMVTWGYAPSSGAFKFYIYGIELQGGKPTTAYSELFWETYAPMKLRRDEKGRAWIDREEYISTSDESWRIEFREDGMVLVKEDGSEVKSISES